MSAGCFLLEYSFRINHRYLFCSLSFVAVVDTLFFTSGFLAVIVLLRHAVEDNHGRLAPSDIFAFMLHRIFRVLPLYGLVLVVYIFIVPLIGSGPFWYLVDGTTTSNCASYWWTNLIFVNNFVPAENNWKQSCAPWTFFLAVDMQLCILAPLAVLLYLSYAFVAIASVVTLLILSVAAGAQAIISNKLDGLLDVSLQPDTEYMVNLSRLLCSL